MRLVEPCRRMRPVRAKVIVEGPAEYKTGLESTPAIIR